MTWEEKMGLAVRRLLRIVLSKADGVPFKVAGVTVKSEADVKRAAEEVLAIDDFLSVSCPEKHIWLSIYTGNDADELLCDYTDNEICNAIANDFQKYYE